MAREKNFNITCNVERGSREAREPQELGRAERRRSRGGILCMRGERRQWLPEKKGEKYNRLPQNIAPGPKNNGSQAK